MGFLISNKMGKATKKQTITISTTMGILSIGGGIIIIWVKYDYITALALLFFGWGYSLLNIKYK